MEAKEAIVATGKMKALAAILTASSAAVSARFRRWCGGDDSDETVGRWLENSNE